MPIVIIAVLVLVALPFYLWFVADGGAPVKEDGGYVNRRYKR